MHRIVTLTMNPAVDKSTEVPNVAPGQKLRCAEPRREPGGGGVNVSRVLQRLGSDVLALLTVGGPTGTMLRDLLQEEGVDSRAVETEAWTRENLMVQEEGGEQQYRFDMPGPSLTRQEWESCLDVIDSMDPFPEILVASGSLPPGTPSDFYRRVARVVEDGGGRMILDTSGVALKEGLEGGVYLVKPNLRELEELAGGDDVESDYENGRVQAARGLMREQGPEAVVLSMGSAGALLVTAEESEKISTPTVPIRSRVGAGDSMVAGIVHGLGMGFDLGKAVRYGVAAGAAAVKTPGSELCRRNDVEALFSRM
jgi:6-phosphofructokinase 2